MGLKAHLKKKFAIHFATKMLITEKWYTFVFNINGATDFVWK